MKRMQLKKLENRFKLMHAQISFITAQQKERQEATLKIINYSKKACRLSKPVKEILSVSPVSNSSIRSFDVYAHLLPSKDTH